MELHSYKSSAAGSTTGVFKFKAKFENANTLITVTVQEKNDSIKIHGYNIDPIGNISISKEVEA